MYDLIGDIHGHADELVQLLELLDYEKAQGSYRHPDRKVIFLGDFIDRAAWGLTGAWTCTVGFPKTRFLFFEGARDERRFKAWVRSQQVVTQVWYSAYPSLSVGEVLANAEIRELLAREPDEMSAARLCRLV